MEVVFGPNSVDEPNLQYKLQRKIKVFNTTNPLPNRGYNLVACASKYGIVFVGSPDGNLTVYYLPQLIDKECEPQHMKVKLQEKPTHIATSCDQELLAVTGGQLVNIYKITDFQNQNVSPVVSIKTEVNPATFVSALQWNPCIPDTIAIAFYDGTLLVFQVSTSQIKKVPSKARCLCWSPKGKQLVTGNNDGTLSQFKPDLTPAKTIPTPNLFENSPVEALAVYWISTFQFAVVFRNATDNSRPAVTILNTPKAGQPSCQNYEDICYSMGSNRPWYYYLQGLAQWNIIMSSSSNSMEIATLGSADGANWVQWCQTDEARPELPLTDKKQENYPVGVSIDTCAIHQLQWDENTTLPHMPLLHVVSQSGLLTIFNIINLNKEAPQVCTPPQQLMLPAAALTTVIPGEAPPQAAPAQVPAPSFAPTPVVQPKPQPMPLTSTPQPPPPTAAPSSQFGGVLNIPKPPSYTQSQSQGFAPAPIKLEQKAPVEVKPIPVIQPTPQPTIPQAQPVVNKPTPAQVQENAALKAEQERMNEMKANQELKNMLVKEVNDFQKELYAFMVKTRESQARMQRDIDSINANFNYNSQDAEQLRKECSPDELRSAIVQLKLELVRACAVIAEARTHAEAKDCHQWMQADPLTMKRVASVKKLAYYVQNQLERAQKALDYKWNEAVSRDANHNKPGQRMIRPILDDVYQPLVKQQEILSRQQAVLRTLRNTLNECDISPMFKTTSLLRSTPFRNKDPLSKLTKNILNMSIDTTDSKKKEPLLSSQKLDALRDMLSNHKTVKIKPVNVEMRQHLATMRTNYEKSLKEKAQPVEAVIKTEPDVVPQVKHVQQQPFVPQVEPKVEVKREPVKQSPITVPSFTPLGGVKPGLNNVARTLFTDEPKIEPPKPQVQVPQPKAAPAFSFSSAPASAETRSVLKDLLQNKQAKNDANTFMGQNICSPSSFAFTTTAASSPPAPTPVFTAKPIADINNMFSKFQPQTFVQEPKPQAFAPEPKPQSFTLETKPQPFALEPKAQPFALETKAQPFALEPKAQPFELEPKAQPFATESKPQGFVTEAKLPSFGLEPKPQALSAESKSATSTAISPKSSETGEPEAETKTITSKPKADKPITNLFAMKTSTPLPSPHAADVLKTPKDVKTDNISKLEDKSKSKENVPQADQKVAQKPSSDSVTSRKPLTAKTSTTPQLVSSSTSSTASSENDSQKPKELKDEAKPEPLKAIEQSDSSTSNTSSSSASSIFAAANATTLTDKAQVTAPSTEQPTSEPDTSTTEAPPTSKPSLFLDITAATSQSAASVFGAAVASQTKPTSPTSIFASGASPSPTPSSVFGTSSQGSIFGNTSPTATTTSVFGSSAQSVFSNAANATKPSVFSTPTPSSPEPSTSPQSVFGSTVTTTTQSGSIFSSSFAQPASSSSPSSVFASGTTSVFGSTATTKASVFGATTTTTQSVFGTPTATTQASIFGSTATTTSASTPSSGAQNIFAAANTTKLSVFGGAGTSVFGSASPNNQTSVFGSPSTQASVFGTGTASTQASVFGTGTATSQSSVFGSGTATSPASVFGSGTATTQSSLFGTPTATTQASVFGTPTTQASVFGSQPTTTAQSGSIFGGAEASLFSAASISTTSAPSPTSGGSIFGGISSGSVFGNANTNVFGGKAAFGQSNATAAAIFGGGGATNFGQQKPATNIWSSSNTNPDGGFGSTAFGQQPTTQASSIFGNTTGGSFSTPSPAGQAFGNPQTNQPFGGADNKPSVFGSPQPAATAFGGSAAFGSKPVFGQPSGFGSPPSGGGFGSTFGGFNKSPGGGFGAPAAFGGGATFGGGAAFGGSSPGKMFGGSAQPSFGSPTQSNATFESLATQNTLTFGNLAQQAQAPQPQAPSFNTSPSFTGWRG